MSLRSNSTPHTPFGNVVSHRILFNRRSKSFKSPLSYPAKMHLSSSLYEFPKPTAQQSLAPPLAGSNEAAGTSFCLGSHTSTLPSRPPVTISGAPLPTPSPPMASMALMIDSCALVWKTGKLRSSRSHVHSLPL
ncbi:hypothetical protein Mapa_004108 [Marchantia paleacea]|nr:hypothetical protein Mapa_004108 [Marchantia paleacea]